MQESKHERHLTIRNVPGDVADALLAEKSRRGASLNQTVLVLLRRALGLTPDAAYENGPERHAGDRSQTELQEFEENTRMFQQIDEELWR